MKHNLLVLALVLVMLSFVSADLGTFKQGEVVPIRVLSNCTIVTLTEVNGESINQVMTNLGGQTHLYNYTNTSTLGTYTFSWNPSCKDCAEVNCGNSFEITPNGYTLSTSQGILYIVFIIGMFGAFILLFYGAIVIPYKNQRADDGSVVGINQMKYLKIFCIIFSYLCLMFISGMLQSIFSNFLLFDNASQFFYTIYWILLSLLFPGIVLSMLFMFINFLNDKKINDALMRGVPFR